MKIARAVLIAGALAGAAVARAAEPPPGGGFALPIDCVPGRTCWVMNYPDMDPGPRAADPACGPRTYDGHKGTDIAIRDRAVMERGIAVLAVAGGTVARVRDGMADRPVTAADRGELRQRECGNGVIIDHGGGWQSQYCHMRRSSIRVRKGDRVAEGAHLGLVGLSGLTEFPHVHLELRRHGTLHDPLTGATLAAACSAGPPLAGSLWRKDLNVAYDGGALYAAGFAAGRISEARIKDDAKSPERLRPDAPALVFWAALFGARRGDMLALTIRTPKGKTLLERRIPIKRTQAWRYAYAGKRRPYTGWDRGDYLGIAELRRGPGAKALVNRHEIRVTLR